LHPLFEIKEDPISQDKSQLNETRFRQQSKSPLREKNKKSDKLGNRVSGLQKNDRFL
jgi:hypothetical protein